MISLDTNVVSEITTTRPAEAVVAWLNGQDSEKLCLEKNWWRRRQSHCSINQWLKMRNANYAPTDTPRSIRLNFPVHSSSPVP